MIIDADGHVVEPTNLFADYLEKEYQDRTPQVLSADKGIRYWLIEGKLIPRVHGTKGGGTPAGFLYSRRRPKMFAKDSSLDDSDGRIKDLDQEGIDVQVMYPTTMLAVASLEDGKLAAALCRAYNNYAAEKCRRYPDRLKPVAALPFQDPQEAVRELRRAMNDLGMVGGMIPGTVGEKNLDHPDFLPFFEAADEMRVALGVHAVTGAYDTPGQERFSDFFYTHMVAMPFALMIAMMTLIGGGVLEKFKNLRFAFLETGCSWVPYWLWRMDDHYAVPHHRPHKLKRKPSDYFKEGRCFVSCEPEEERLGQIVTALGEENILYASDYPHGDSRFPETVKTLRARDDLSEETKKKILGDNAARLYGF